jgi:hypothetical protein
MNGGITKDTWKKAAPELRDEMLFDLVVDLRNEIKTIKKWKYVNTTVCGICGFIGGITAVLGSKIFL